jgi:hypothetical protein
MRPGLTPAEITQLPAVVDLVAAGRAKSYQLAKDGHFPVRLIRAGRSYLVPTADLLTLLGLPTPAPTREE